MERPLASKLPDARGFFAEVTHYIGFGPEDSERLQAFLPKAMPHFERISEHFYERIVVHPQAHEAITGGDEQIARLKRTLVEWMRSGLAGPHDEDFCLRRARIGHIHVRIGLPQRYMITAMNVMRLDFREVAREAYATGDPVELEYLHTSLERLFDLELAIMLETYKLAAEEHLRRRERLATIGQLAASVGHELRNPLSVMESSLYILRGRVTDDRATKHVDKIANQIRECDRIITNLLDMARDQPPRRESVRAADLLDAALTAVRVPANFEVVREGLADLELWVDVALLKQAFINLLINSVQAQRGQEGRICVRAHVEGCDATISVIDAGPGFDHETLPIIFEPLVTTKATGTGLGLALVKNVTERHGGHVSADNRMEGGAEVKMFLPSAVPTCTEPTIHLASHLAI
jgi:two-component system sensor histidine kinase HydH